MADILFVCVHNSGRSQMAEAIFNLRAAERGLELTAASAGTLGAGEINPVAQRAMADVQIEMIGQFPKRITQEMVDRAAVVISMGCGVDADACPARLTAMEDWDLDDPNGASWDKVVAIRDQIAAKVDDLIDKLLADPRFPQTR